ncbi:YihY/virulence factor BrkB family protein [Ectothiorhodospiraceae bacterium BW-2]|nr:YihY/virulence factor BrkB family protein [Ectothiorhodospiraceae bacterium BW-2]
MTPTDPHTKPTFWERLWHADPAEQPRPQRLATQLLQLLWVLRRDIFIGELNLRAMSLVYTTLLSLVPLLAVSFSMLKAFGVHNQIEPMLINFVAPMGEMGVEIINRVLEFVERMKVGVLGSVGLAILLFTVISLVQKIEQALNYVWRVKQPRTIVRRFSDYLSVIMVGPVLIFSAMGMSASIRNHTIVQQLLEMEALGTLILLLGKLIPFLFVTTAFFFIYLFIPNTRIGLRPALLGAAAAGGLWQSIGLLFGHFAAGATSYAAIYSGLAILILFMIWLYLNWLILLIGAQIAYYIQYPRQIRREPLTLPRGLAYRQLMVLLMVSIVRRFESEAPPITLEELNQQSELPRDLLELLLQKLLSYGFIATCREEPEGYLPTTAPEKLQLNHFLQVVDSNDTPPPTWLAHESAIAQLFSSLSEAREERLGALNFSQLAADNFSLRTCIDGRGWV